MNRKWMNLKTAAEYLDMTPAALRQQARLGKIPSVRLGKLYRFDKAELDRLLQNKRKETEHEDITST